MCLSTIKAYLSGTPVKMTIWHFLAAIANTAPIIFKNLLLFLFGQTHVGSFCRYPIAKPRRMRRGFQPVFSLFIIAVLPFLSPGSSQNPGCWL